MSETRDTRFQAADTAIASYSTIIDELIKVAEFAARERKFDAVALLLGNAMQATAMRTQLATALAEEHDNEERITRGRRNDNGGDNGGDNGDDNEHDPLDIFSDD